MKIPIIPQIVVALALLSGVLSATPPQHAEINAKARHRAAATLLTQKKNTVQVYARGLICPSCAIGVRKKLQRLAFVDQKRFNKGVALDPSTQLVTIALKKGQKADPAAISKAIKKAGYAPVMLYQRSPKGKVTQTPLK